MEVGNTDISTLSLPDPGPPGGIVFGLPVTGQADRQIIHKAMKQCWAWHFPEFHVVVKEFA